MFQSILIATDFSPAAWKAVHVGIKLGQNQPARISILHIYPSEWGARNIPSTQLLRMKEIKENMKRISEAARFENKIEICNEVLTGRVRKELIAFINKNRFDLVIMGINGDGSSNDTGSNTKHILEKASTPILVIPNNYQLDG